MGVLNISIAVIGASTCGKTQFVRRFTGKEYSPEYVETKEIAEYTCLDAKNGINYKFYDIPGSFIENPGEYNKMRIVLNKIDFVIMMFSVSSVKSFGKINVWKSFIGDDIRILYVGTKDDIQCISKHLMKYKMTGEFQDRITFYVSSKCDLNIKYTFHDFLVLKKILLKGIPC